MWESLMPMILGPFGALVILCVVLYGAYVFVDKRIMPLVDKVFDRFGKSQEDLALAFKAIATSHQSDRETWSKLLSDLTHAVKELRSDLDDLKTRTNTRP